MYYRDKLDTLRDLFGTEDLTVAPNGLRVRERVYPILDDVIILLEPERMPASIKTRLSRAGVKLGSAIWDGSPEGEFAEDIQFTFGEEWEKFSQVLPEHEQEFRQYFDLVDLDSLRTARVGDLGCGIGRWAFFLKDRVRELVLVDFSKAIFVARENLCGSDNALFFMGDIRQLPFRDRAIDFTYCFGVLHHLPVDALAAVRNLRRLSPRLLVYLYYALDDRPAYFRVLLSFVTFLRRGLCRAKAPAFREAFTWFGAIFLYLPLIMLGRALQPFGLGRLVPLYEGYRDAGLRRIRQDVYDRFFTSIEQRVTRKQIRGLEDAFSRVTISDGIPYWHFLCEV